MILARAFYTFYFVLVLLPFTALRIAKGTYIDLLIAIKAMAGIHRFLSGSNGFYRHVAVHFFCVACRVEYITHATNPPTFS